MSRSQTDHARQAPGRGVAGSPASAPRGWLVTAALAVIAGLLAGLVMVMSGQPVATLAPAPAPAGAGAATSETMAGHGRVATAGREVAGSGVMAMAATGHPAGFGVPRPAQPPREPGPGFGAEAVCSPPAPPPAPPAPPAPGSAPAAPNSTEDPGWIDEALTTITGWVTDHVVLPGLDPLLRLMSGVLLNAPDPRCMPGMVELWGHTRTIAVALYGLLITAAALIVMGHQTVQTRYSARDLAPRLVLGFAAANLSLWIIGLAVGFGNALTASVLGTADTTAAQSALRELIDVGMREPQAGAWLIFVIVAFLAVVVLVLIGYVQRLALLAILTVAAPLALACHALPGLDRLAAWWWRAFAALLCAQFAQALTLVVSLKIFLAPGAVAGSGVLADPDMRVFLALGVVVLMAVIPIRVMSAAKLGQGTSMLSSVVRTVLMIKTLGAVKAGRAATGAGGRAAAGRARPGVPRHPGIGPRHWPYGSATGPAGRSLAAARQAHRAQAPGQPRPAPGRLRPPGQPATPPGMPHTLRPPRPGAQPPPPGADTRPAGGRASNAPRPNPRPLVTRAPGTSGPRPAPPPTVTPRPAVRRTDAPPRAGGRTTPPRARPAVSPRPPHPSGRRRPR